MTFTSRTRSALIALVAVLGVLALTLRPALAQTYIFSVPTTKMQVYVQDDGSAHIIYDITFENSGIGSALDVFDIGMPNENYRVSRVEASLDGVAASNIYQSPYVSPGVAIEVSNPIDSGASGTLHVEADVEQLVYQDVTRSGYASLQITPTWFDSSLVTQGGDLDIAIYMLPGITPDEVLQQQVPFSDKVLFGERAVALFHKSGWGATSAYEVGVSFPDRGLTNLVRQNVLQLVNLWLEQNPGVALLFSAVAFGLMALAFFRFSGGTGIVVFVAVAAGLGCAVFNVPALALLLAPIAVAAVIFVEVSLVRRKKQYLPPIAQVEGGGIKRGLTAAEAAVLLEEPLGKIVTLVIFGLLRKGVLTQVPDAKLRVKVESDFAGLKKSRLEVAQAKGIVLHEYEHAFISALQGGAGEGNGMLVEKADFSGATKELISGAAARMAGFDLSDTQAYYRGIIKRALTEAAAIGDLKIREKQVDTDLEWILLDRNYPTVFNRPGWTYQPMWVRPWATGGFPSTSGTTGGGLNLGGGSRPSSGGGGANFGDVASGFAGWAENTMGGLANTILPGTLSVPSRSGGFTDLSGFDKVTGDVFEALAKAASENSKGGGGGSSGGGRSCACACAGCACACACAGGGR